MTRPPKKLRKQFTNNEHDHLVLRFEDGHEIHLKRGTGKSFDVWPGETIKILSVYDPHTSARELLYSRKSDDFEDFTE